MPFYSGRIDQIYDEIYYYELDDEPVASLTMMEVFDNFTEKFECEHFVFAFEDKDKTGMFPRKPHYHFFFKSDCKQDTMRRFLTSYGFNKELASLHKIKDAQEMEKAICYTLKQQTVVFTDLQDTQLQDYLTASLNYNDQLDKSKNITLEIMEKILEQLSGLSRITRDDIAKLIYTEYSIINASAKDWSEHYCFPNHLQLLRMIQYIESKTSLSSYESWYMDNHRFINPSIHKEHNIAVVKENAYSAIWED